MKNIQEQLENLIKDFAPKEDQDHLIAYLDSLKHDSDFLACLESAGVDNWDGYEFAKDDYNHNNH